MPPIPRSETRSVLFLRKAVLVANRTDPVAEEWRNTDRLPRIPASLAQALTAIEPDDLVDLPATCEPAAASLKVIARTVNRLAVGGVPDGSWETLLAAARMIREAAREVSDSEQHAQLAGLERLEVSTDDSLRALTTLLRRVIIRLEEDPDILITKDWRWEGGLASNDLNRLAQRTVLSQTDDGDERVLRFHHPAEGDDEPCDWRVWCRVGLPDSPRNAAKLSRTLRHLRAWLEWATSRTTQAPTPLCETEPRAGRNRADVPSRQAARSAAPLPQDMRVLEFMLFWEHELRTGASRLGHPEHYRLPEHGDSDNDRAALKLLRACCERDYLAAERVILPLLNTPPAFHRPILARMRAIVDDARLAAARAALFDSLPAATTRAVEISSPAPEATPAHNQSQVQAPVLPPCPGCESQPAADDVDDVCPQCGAFYFRCGQIRHYPLPLSRNSPPVQPIIQQARPPCWERIPPSQVVRPVPRSAPPPSVGPPGVQGSASAPLTTAQAQPTPADPDVFIPAKHCLELAKQRLGQSLTYKQLHALLERHPSVRTDKPTPQRLTIHAGDFSRLLEHLRVTQSDPLDLPSEVVDAAVREVENRKATERERKTGK